MGGKPLDSVTLSVLRQNLHLALITKASAERVGHVLLVASEERRIAWLGRQIAELEARVAGEGHHEDAPEQATTL
jgi:hypothetical protein